MRSHVRRLKRVLTLLDTLQSRRLNAGELAEICGVSRRTIFRDLAALRSADVPLHYDEQLQQYSITPRQRRWNQELSRAELAAVCTIGHIISSDQPAIPFRRTVRSAVDRILHMAGEGIESDVVAMQEAIVMDLGSQMRLAEKEGEFQTILESICRKRCVRIRYREVPGEATAVRTLLSPYHLIYRRGRWFVLGRSSWHRGIQMFDLEGVENVEVVDQCFQRPMRLRIDRYLNSVLSSPGVSGKPTEVTVTFDTSVAKEVAGTCWDKSQTIQWNDDGTIIFRATVNQFDGVAKWILGFGDRAEVHAPLELRRIVAAEISRMHQRYSRRGCPTAPDSRRRTTAAADGPGASAPVP